MKAKLLFDLDNPDDAYEFKLVQRAAEFSRALWEVDRQLRDWLKHGHNFKTPEEVMEATRQKISDELDSPLDS